MKQEHSCFPMLETILKIAPNIDLDVSLILPLDNRHKAANNSFPGLYYAQKHCELL
jgi:hypothetical protein